MNLLHLPFEIVDYILSFTGKYYEPIVSQTCRLFRELILSSKRLHLYKRGTRIFPKEEKEFTLDFPNVVHINIRKIFTSRELYEWSLNLGFEEILFRPYDVLRDLVLEGSPDLMRDVLLKIIKETTSRTPTDSSIQTLPTTYTRYERWRINNYIRECWALAFNSGKVDHLRCLLELSDEYSCKVRERTIKNTCVPVVRTSLGRSVFQGIRDEYKGDEALTWSSKRIYEFMEEMNVLADLFPNYEEDEHEDDYYYVYLDLKLRIGCHMDVREEIDRAIGPMTKEEIKDLAFELISMCVTTGNIKGIEDVFSFPTISETLKGVELDSWLLFGIRNEKHGILEAYNLLKSKGMKVGKETILKIVTDYLEFMRTDTSQNHEIISLCDEIIRIHEVGKTSHGRTGPLNIYIKGQGTTIEDVLITAFAQNNVEVFKYLYETTVLHGNEENILGEELEEYIKSSYFIDNIDVLEYCLKECVVSIPSPLSIFSKLSICGDKWEHSLRFERYMNLLEDGYLLIFNKRDDPEDSGVIMASFLLKAFESKCGASILQKIFESKEFKKGKFIEDCFDYDVYTEFTSEQKEWFNKNFFNPFCLN